MKGLCGLILLCLFVGAPGVGFAKGTGYIFVSSEKDHVVTVFKPGSLELVQKIPTKQRPRSMRFSNDHSRIYVACGDDDTIDVIDVDKLKVVKSIAIDDDPDRFDLGPDEGSVINGKSNDRSIIDTKRLKLIRLVPEVRMPHDVPVDN